MNKEEKTLTLLSEIGEIDDIYLKEATSFKSKRPRRNIWVPLIAACLTVSVMATVLLSLSVMVPLGLVMIGNELDLFNGFTKDEAPELNLPPIETEGGIKNEDNDAETEEESVAGESPNDSQNAYAVLDLILEDAMDGGRLSVDSDDKLSYGESSIIWQDGESGEIFVEQLTHSELEAVKRNLGKGDAVGESSPKITHRIWIVDENRSVISPYLESGLGNESFAIFDYEAEIIPSDELIECISDILK